VPGGALPHVVQPVCDPVGAMRGALSRVLTLGSVLQPVALPAAEIASAIEFAAAPAAFDAREPLASAAGFERLPAWGAMFLYHPGYSATNQPQSRSAPASTSAAIASAACQVLGKRASQVLSCSPR